MSSKFVPSDIGTHDVASLPPPIEPALSGNLKKLERPNFFWELQIHAALVALVKKNFMSVDELRVGVEQLEPALQEKLSYYEKWTLSMLLALVNRNVITRRDVEAVYSEYGDLAADDDDSGRVVGNFNVGDRVTVKSDAVHRRWRRPHLRVPGYINGQTGVVTEVVGKFYDPAYTAFRDHVMIRRATNGKNSSSKFHSGKEEEEEELPGMKQPLYRVRFHLQDVRHYAPDGKSKHAISDDDYIFLDVFHPWLQKYNNNNNNNNNNISAVKNRSDGVRFFSAPLSSSQKKMKHDDHVHNSRCDVEQVALQREREFPLQSLAELFIAIITQRKNLVTADELRQIAEKISNIPEKLLGQKLVARAWVDPEFKKRLLSDARAAAQELGITTSNYATNISLHPGASGGGDNRQQQQKQESAMKEFAHGHTELRVVENTDKVHNLVVCTLCSCFPAAVLGPSPQWYKSRNYRSRAVHEPREMLKMDFGLDVPQSVSIHIHDSTAENRYLVLPMRPRWTEGWSEDELIQVISRDSMIGVAVIGGCGLSKL